jgi:Papain family cysteine protease
VSGIILQNQIGYYSALAAQSAAYFGELAADVPIPPAIDWRSYEGSNWVQDVLDQGATQACFAYAAAVVVRAGLRCALGDAALELMPDPQTLAQVAGAGDYAVDPELGCQNLAGLDLFAGGTLQARVHPLPVVGDQLGERLLLVTTGPTIGFIVLENLPGENLPEHERLHALAIVGFDQNNEVWIVQNSWGSNWGSDGYSEIGYGEYGIDTMPYFTLLVDPL